MLYVKYSTPEDSTKTSFDSNPLVSVLFNDAPDAIFILDAKTYGIQDCNKKALDLFETESKSSLINLPSFRLYESEPVEFSRNLLEINIRNSGEHTQELSFRTFKQNIFWGKLRKRSLRIDDKDYIILRISKAIDYFHSEEVLSTLLRGTAKVTGTKFFKELTRLLCRNFEVKEAMVMKVSGNGEFLNLIEGSGTLINDSNEKYPVKMSVMENVLKGYTTFYPQGVCELFPNDNFINTNKIEAFMGTPIFGSSGEVIGVIAFMNDKVINEIPNSRYILSIFASRAAAEMQRIKSKEILKEQARNLSKANQVKDSLLNIVTNDLVQPLHGLMGFTNHLTQNAEMYEKAKLIDKLAIIDNSVRNINFMFENLSGWSKIFQEKIRPAKEKVELNKIIEENISLFNNIAVIKGLHFISNMEGSPEVVSDKNMIGTIVRNLLSNAVKFSERDSEISINCELNKKEVKITICDRGIGFSLIDLQNIIKEDFNPKSINFEREENAGLGLMLSKYFIKQLGGKLNIHSIPFVETKVSFTIPF